MKINGKTLDGPKPNIIPILRGDDTIIFKAQAITDYSEFDAICKEPEPPLIRLKGNSAATPALKDKAYLEAVQDHSKKRVDYMIIKSLEATDGLEWDTVKLDDPNTFKNYESDLQNAGITIFEISRIIDSIMDINGLNEDRIEEARKRFLAQELGVVDKQSTSVVEQ